MLTILLFGELGKRFGRRHRMDVRSPAEAVRALCANFPDFREFMARSHERNVGYRVITAKRDIDAEQLHDPASKQIVFAPVIAGAGGSPLGKILLGAIIIGTAFLTGGATLVAGQGIVFSGFLAQAAFGIGVSLALGGVAQLLAPTPPALEPMETETSYVFDGPVNTTAQGQPVPIGYGRMIVGSAVISAGLTVDDVQA
jgi:predicted phage tail protein